MAASPVRENKRRNNTAVYDEASPDLSTHDDFDARMAAGVS
jgi:hypothetical protein